MDSNLLQEAIADAKAVRKTALANARVALEEAFSERYHAMFAEKLKEDAMDEKHMDGKHMANDTMKHDDNVSSQEIDELIRELEAEVGGDIPHTEPGAEMPHVDAAPAVPGAPMVPGVPAVPGAPVPPGCPPVAPLPAIGSPVSPMPGAPMDASMPPTVPSSATPPPSDVPPVAGEETDEDINLDELLESLKGEIEDECDKDEKKDEKVEESHKLASSGIAPGGNKKPSSASHDSSDIESGGMKNHGWPESKQTSDEKVDVTMPEKNFGKNKDGNLATNSPLKETIALKNKGWPESEQTSDEDIDVTMPDKNFGKNKDGNLAKTSHIKEENEALKKQLNEAEEVIKYVKTQLNEVNLMNAKLLYTNKLFKEFTMHNDQKLRIVEMFDLAKNVREVKLTYANIAESLNFGGSEKKKRAKEVSPSVQGITEGLASKQVGSTKPSKEIISESKTSGMVSKFQKLAGIKRS